MEDWELYLHEFIMHEGVAHDENPPGRGSGRYAFGSGNRPHQHDWDIYSRIEKLKAANPNASDTELAYLMGIYKTDKDGNYILDENGNKQGNSTQFRAIKQIAANNKKRDQFDELSYYDNHLNPNTGKHYTDTQIAEKMGLPSESSVRSMRNTMMNGKTNKTNEVADILRKESKEKGYLDVGSDVALYLGTASGSLNTALEMLKKEGYTLETVRIKQLSNPLQSTTIRVLCPPGSENDIPIRKHPQDIKMVTNPGDHDNDINDALINRGLGDPPRVSLDRINIRYDEEGGTQRDGLIQIRAVRDKNGNLVAACPDLSLGNARYGQVRIAVEGDRYIKGMAVYDENLKGADILVNSNKSIEGGVDKALKKLQTNKDGTLATNIFGSTVVQTVIRDKNGNPVLDKDGKQIPSAINFVGTNEGDKHVEGHWGTWSKNLSAQFLSKQPLSLVKSQLKQQSELMEAQLKDINELNNPTVKRKMLIDFADQADAAAVDMKAAPIPGQKTRVLIPEPSLKDNECYAPGLPNGTTVALVRFPHAGRWEIPILQVNNNNKEAKRLLGDNASDAIAINHHNHGVLSGADSDGDTAVVIPMTRKTSSGEFERIVDVRNMPPLNGYLVNQDGSKTSIKLSEFDPTAAYSTSNPRFSHMQDKDGNPTYPYFKKTSAKGKEMGKTTNLILDMQLKGCSDPNELARVDMYSMVVIDAQKHKLNYKQAYEDFGIEELKQKYQMKPNGKAGGAATLLTRSGSPEKIPLRGMWRDTDIDPDTGEKIYRDPIYKTESKATKPVYVDAPAGYVYVDKQGKPHKYKHMRDENGEKIVATWDGKVVQNQDGTYSYDKGSGKKKWTYETVERTEEIPKLMKAYMEGKNASSLLSNGDDSSQIEKTYATYADHMHALANKARKQSLTVKPISYNPSAAKEYSTEVKQLREALTKAEMNAPRERQAQILATSTYNARIQGETDLDSDDRRKIRGQELALARKVCGAEKARIQFTEKQWEAINKGAIPPTLLEKMLANADKNSYVSLALPRKNQVSDAKKARIQQLFDKGWSYEEIAENIGVSTASVSNVINN